MAEITEEIILKSTKKEDKMIKLLNFDSPNMILVSSPLNGNNYVTWSRSMVIALKTKDKLEFINGKCKVPEQNDKSYEEWQKADNMVMSWILNTLSKDLVEAFLYATNAYELSEELKSRFGDSNGPLMYQLMKEINNISQANNPLMMYYTKLKKMWDECACLEPILVCDCGVVKSFAHMESKHKLMKFLMGLNVTYDHIRNQILII